MSGVVRIPSQEVEILRAKLYGIPIMGSVAIHDSAVKFERDFAKMNPKSQKEFLERRWSFDCDDILYDGVSLGDLKVKMVMSGSDSGPFVISCETELFGSSIYRNCVHDSISQSDSSIFKTIEAAHRNDFEAFKATFKTVDSVELRGDMFKFSKPELIPFSLTKLFACYRQMDLPLVTHSFKQVFVVNDQLRLIGEDGDAGKVFLSLEPFGTQDDFDEMLKFLDVSDKGYSFAQFRWVNEDSRVYHIAFDGDFMRVYDDQYRYCSKVFMKLFPRLKEQIRLIISIAVIKGLCD